MIEIAIICWLASGFIGSMLWLWAEWEFRHFGYAPMWWHIVYPTMIGPIGLLIGTTLAISKLRSLHTSDKEA